MSNSKRHNFCLKPFHRFDKIHHPIALQNNFIISRKSPIRNHQAKKMYKFLAIISFRRVLSFPTFIQIHFGICRYIFLSWWACAAFIAAHTFIHSSLQLCSLDTFSSILLLSFSLFNFVRFHLLSTNRLTYFHMKRFVCSRLNRDSE